MADSMCLVATLHSTATMAGPEMFGHYCLSSCALDDFPLQAVRALCMLAIMYILMWSFGLLPTQSEEFMAGRSAAVTQPAAAAAAAVAGGGPEDV